MRLIDADLPMRSFQVDMCGGFACHECPLLNDDGECGFEVFISDTPTVDAVPVVHGHWKSVDSDVVFECSNCACEVSTSWDYDQDEMWSYCPHCGAKMDEVMNDENK